jgi:hypothetical protein
MALVAIRRRVVVAGASIAVKNRRLPREKHRRDVNGNPEDIKGRSGSALSSVAVATVWPHDEGRKATSSK